MSAFLAKKIGWIGTGVMGNSMCTHLLNKGLNLSVYTRTKSKAENLLNNGAKWLEPAELAANSDIVVMMLGYPHDVQQMCLGSKSILKHMNSGSFVIDHTTSQPFLAQRISKQCLKYNLKSIDAPVTGGDVGAREGKLITLCGGDKNDFTQIKQLLEIYSKSVERFGEAGRGQHAKLTNQIILAGNMIGMVQGLLYASKMGMDLNQIINTIKQGAAGSTSLGVLGQRIADNNYDPGFYVEHYVKDMRIALEQAERAKLCLPNLALVKQFYTALMAQGGSKLGTQALMKVLEEMNNHRVNKN